VPVLLDEQDGGGVDLEDVGEALQQLGEQLVQIQIGEGRFGDPLDVLEPGRGLPYSVEMLGSAWTFSGMIIRKFFTASAARPVTRSASPVWSVVRSSVA